MTTKEEIKAICKYYGVDVEFMKYSYGCCGFSDYTNFKIRITPKAFRHGRGVLLITTFHELGHIYCYINSIYKKYHYSKPYNKLTKKDKKAVRLTGFKAECFVERWAEKEMKKYYPSMKYRAYYGNEESKKWLRENHLNKWYK